MEKESHDAVAAAIVTKAIAAIVLDDPFYGYLLLRQHIVQDPRVGTACTDGFRITYSPKFVRDQTLAQVKGLLKHEVMHIAHMHQLRRGKREHRKWNRACDYAINPILVAAGVSLPDGGLNDPAYTDMGAEHIYNLLPEEPKNDGLDWNWGGINDAPGSENETTNIQMTEDVRQEVIQALNAARMMGKLPAGLERLAGKIHESRLPWRRILARLFKATAKNDYTWSRPNRRYIAHDMYLPSLYSETLGPIVIGVDTSGSIAEEELGIFFGCVNGILRQTKPSSVHVVYCDAEVGNVQIFNSGDYPIKAGRFKPRGGGGTDFRPVFDYVAEKRLTPCALLYMTDLLGSFPEKPPKYPVIWCATTEGKAPFGRTVEVK